ncbi:uncharacterized protein LOC108033186 [Drosophila biarmipes]|uniref:uncharacterized protein LOC108033186 n=1 Tax=Drosophila biarmipes TaxID=125945 RepID=UPI0007E69B7C|nr:uncharacterized protein LOC108033186 [Drosophila biarmipes]
MERRRPRKSSRHFLRSKSNPSVGGGGGGPSAATSRVSSQQPDGNGGPTITSLLGGRLKRVSRIARASRGMHVTENPEEGGVGFAPFRDSDQSDGSDVNPGVMVIPGAASPRGSAVHGPLVGVAFGSMARSSDSPRISEEVEEVFRTSSQRSVSVVGTGNLRFDSTPGGRDESTTGNINFAPNSYYEQNRHSSMESDESNGNGNDIRVDSTPSLGACSHGWTQQQHQPASGHAGRDTLGFAIHLGTATLGHNRCSLGVNCDEDCGYGTGCDAGCGEAHGIDPGSFVIPGPAAPGPALVMQQAGPPVNSALRGAQGPAVGPAGGYAAGGGYKPGPPGQRGSMGSDFGSDQLNFFITFLLEVLGVLVFFAICTITFWITLGYHVVQLLVDLKNADRNVQVAVAIVFGLLLIAFAISQVTNRSGACCHSRDRARSRSKGGGMCPFHRSTKSKAKPKSCAPKTKSCAYKPKNKRAPNEAGGCRRASSCAAKIDFHSHRKTRYTDCEGRAIFLSSRRYAIPTEMKQPPTIVLWLRDAVAHMMQ